MHLFKSDDELHEEWSDYDETLREVFSSDYTLNVAAGDAGGGDVEDEPDALATIDDGGESTPSGEDLVVGFEEPDDVDQEAATDGGPRAPPEPEIPDEPEPEPEETVPDHLVPVEEFVEDAEAELPAGLVESDEWEAFADELRNDPEGYVDVRASNVAAGKVRTTDA